ncbi:glycosyltransferase family 61 protein [Bacteroides sp. AM10-21B]|uniref:glycosyltransferase family 61 protein n=1 Tax=Bacteroides sp. AM10-21B TaxID=2292001 RepID=UPI000E52F662|nr:glycosyltransferase 61 family protein [Bacteroides sp. AM10-21B]RHJ47601.1 glycosyltransferase family 61 protein [Bacteroides sp. AM10-21B]
MKLVIKLYHLSPRWVQKTWHSLKKRILRLISPTYLIIKNPTDVLEKVYKVKDDTWENSYYPECYGHCKEQHLSVFSPEEFIFKEKNAVISVESDVVITSKGVYWDKYNDEEFLTWAIPCDQNVIWYDKNYIGIIKYRKRYVISGLCLSLIGVWSSHWGHCMYQFLPKLFTAGEAGLLNQPITIIIAETEDAAIMEMVHNYISNYGQVKILYAKSNTDYICEELLFMPTSGSNFNSPKFRLDYPYYISHHVLEKTKRYVIDPLIEKIKDNPTKYEKIFLSRRGLRTLVNYDEVYDYFKSLGYKEIEGSTLTLEEKADIFYHAKEIVGLYGSAFLNLMFCNQAKSIVLINYKMSTDTSLYLQIRDYVQSLINVTGQDDSDDYHTNYYISLEKIKKVYQEYMN